MSKINKIQVDETTYDIEDLSVPSWAKQENKPTYSYSEIQNTPDLSNFITKDVNNLTYYELKTATGNSIAMSIDSSTYVLTVSLKNSAGTILNTQTVDLPLETMVVGGSYDSTNKKIILTLKNGQTIEFSVADLVSGLQSEITSNNKLSADLVDDTSTTNKFVSASDITNWNAKVDVDDYATSETGGVVKINSYYGLNISGTGVLSSPNETYNRYLNYYGNNSVISKGTLENVITGKGLVNSTDLATKQDIIQYSTMPTASSSNVGKIVQFTGTTDSTYTNGYFYIGIDTSGIYSWERIDVQPSSSNDVYVIDEFDNSSGYGTFIFGSKPLGTYLLSSPDNNLDGYKKISSSTKQYFSMYNKAIKPLIIYYYKDVNKIGTPSSNTYFATMIGISTYNETIYYARMYIDTSGNIIQYSNVFPGNLITDGKQTFNGVKTFSSFPITPSSAPTTNYQVANKKYVDDKIGDINTILATLTTPQGGE